MAHVKDEKNKEHYCLQSSYQRKEKEGKRVFGSTFWVAK